MQVNEIKHQAKLAEWKRRIMECRSSGKSVMEWCREKGYTRTTYYRWEREIFGRASRANVSEDQQGPLPPMHVELAELAVANNDRHEVQRASGAMTSFNPVAILRVGKVEISLSNCASANLMRQIKELLRDAE